MFYPELGDINQAGARVVCCQTQKAGKITDQIVRRAKRAGKCCAGSMMNLGGSCGLISATGTCTQNKKANKHCSTVKERICYGLQKAVRKREGKAMVEVAAALIFQEGRFLICQRGGGGSCANLWEFPGGKREAGETLEECLVRECREELGVEVAVGDCYFQTTHRYPERTVALSFYWARICAGSLQQRVHQAVRFVLPEELENYSFCPADETLIQRLKEEFTRQ